MPSRHLQDGPESLPGRLLYETAVLVAEPDGTLRERRDDEVTNASSQHDLFVTRPN